MQTIVTEIVTLDLRIFVELRCATILSFAEVNWDQEYQCKQGAAGRRMLMLLLLVPRDVEHEVQ